MIKRRQFLQGLATATAAAPMGAWAAADPSRLPDPDEAIRAKIEASRPSQLKLLPPNFNARVGTTHVAGKYHLADRPYLNEGARRMIELGTKLGKFWFDPSRAASDYRFNSAWSKPRTLVELAETDYWQQVWDMPFATLMLEAHEAVDNGWERERPAEFFAAVTAAYEAITAWFYRRFRQRKITIILQHWEGDWLLRGAGAKWDSPPADWKMKCERMQRWLAARQAGVNKARAAALADAKCRVAHAAEVNRVLDLHRGIPTMTDQVLPGVELDLVSYSAYDAMKDGVTLYKAIETIRRHARTGKLFGPGAVYLGEIGIPENEQPSRIAERWDEWLGAALAANALYVAQWELYCNELNPRLKPAPAVPIKQFQEARGFWLVRPDGSLSETGKYFQALWRRGGSGDGG